MKQYTIFFSWQNDRKGVKKIIMNALNKAKASLAKEGIELILDEDTRGRVGNRDIVHAVLEKIQKCDIFLADVTPVATMYKDVEGRLPKHLPNSNVMFEYGYALSCKGENRMITLAKMGRGEHVEFMPFDINHNTLTTFKTADDLSHLVDWIKNIIVVVDKERANVVPDYECDVVFMGNLNGSQTTIKPIFKKTVYITKEQQKAFAKMNEKVEAIVKTSRKVQMFNVGKQQINKSYCMVRLWFINKGNMALDNCNLTIEACDSRVHFAKTNVEQILNSVFHTRTQTFVHNDIFSFHVNTLNPGDSSMIDAVYVYAPHDIGSFLLTWNLSSRTLRKNGTLEVLVESDFNVNYVENGDRAGEEEIEDCIVTE